ncbi:CTP synthetase, partial [Mycoplasma putrefaciens]
MAKFIFITGGVVSGLGKGITASSIGALLEASGLKVFMQKFDPYLNVDPGTMSPYQHGEVFVTADGGETDLDLGHYERFVNEELSKISSTSAGKIYLEVIEGERRGDSHGKTIQVVPHITDAIKHKVYLAAQRSKADVVISEIGGTVGDIESQPFIEAIRQIRMEQGKENVMFIHVVLLLW